MCGSCITRCLTFGQIAPEFFGIHINNLNNPWPNTVGIEFSNYRTLASGATLWSQLNPSPGVYDWKWLDIALGQSEQHGSQVDFDFYFTPSWASSNRSGSCVMGDNGGCYPPNDLNSDGTGTDQHVKDFITALMDRVGAGRLKYIEIWNEFNISLEWHGTIGQLVRITKDVSTVAKSFDANIRIIGPSATGDCGGKYIDVISLHGHIKDPEKIIVRTNSALAQMAKYGQGGKPIFDTEASWPLNWPVNTGIAADLQPGYLFREYLATLSTPTQVMYVYAYDIAKTAHYWSTSLQKVTTNGNAYALFYTWLVGSTVTNKCQPQVSGSSTWSCTFEMRDGTKAMAMWNTAVTYPNTVSTTVPSVFKKYFTLNGGSHLVGQAAPSVQRTSLGCRDSAE